MSIVPNRIKKIMSVTLLIIMIITNSFPIYADTSRAAKIADLSGTVNVLKSGGEKKFKAFKGMSLSQGDSISTGKDSWVEIEIDDDKLVKIAEETQLGVSELQGSVEAGNDQTGLKLWFGKVWTNIKNKLNIRSKYEIRTPKTVMGVRGTQFYVGSDGSKTIVAVYEGRVYAVSYSSEVKPDGTVLEQAIEGYIEKDQQTLIDESVIQSGITVQPATLQLLPSSILESIKNNPEGLNPELMKDIVRTIEEKKSEEQRIQNLQKQQEEQQSIQITQDPGTSQPPASAPSSGSSGSSGTSSSPNTPAEIPDTRPSIGITVKNIEEAVVNDNIKIKVGKNFPGYVLANPTNATISAVSSNEAIARVEIEPYDNERQSLFIDTVSAGVAEITITATCQGYKSTTKTLSIEVLGLYMTKQPTGTKNGLIISPGNTTHIAFSDHITDESKEDVTAKLQDSVVYQGSPDTLNIGYDWIFDDSEADELRLTITNNSTQHIQLAVSGNVECTVTDQYNNSKNLVLIKHSNSDFKVTEAKILDENKDGKLDTLMLVFNGSVMDNSINSGLLSIQKGSPDVSDFGTIDTSAVVQSSHVTDNPNDSIVCYAINNSGAGYNTDFYGILNISNSESLATDPAGNATDPMGNLVLSDVNAPVITKWTIDMSGNGDNKEIRLYLSENVPAQNIDLQKLHLSGSGDSSISYEELSGTVFEVSMDDSENQYCAIIKSLGAELVRRINAIAVINYFDSHYYLSYSEGAARDQNNNYSAARDNGMMYNGIFNSDLESPAVVSVNTDPENSDTIIVMFNDYLDKDFATEANMSTESDYNDLYIHSVEYDAVTGRKLKIKLSRPPAYLDKIDFNSGINGGIRDTAQNVSLSYIEYPGSVWNIRMWN